MTERWTMVGKCSRRTVIVSRFPVMTVLTLFVMYLMMISSKTMVVLATQQQQQRQIQRIRCPPKGFDAIQNFNLTSYVSARWYVIQQEPLIYSSEETFCSYAQYTIDTKSPIPFYCRRRRLLNCKDDIRIDVVNRGLIDSVTGEPNIANLSAWCPNPITEPAKIQVSFNIPGRTNYWIVAAGTYTEAVTNTYMGKPQSDNYEWAVISGGPPNVRTDRNKCVAGRFGKYDVRGLWMFARQPIPVPGVIEGVTAIAESMGLDTTVWRPVNHEGCVDY
jgi:lipocalin